MSWALLFRAREYLRGSLWFYPLAGAILGALLALLTKQVDASVTVPKTSGCLSAGGRVGPLLVHHDVVTSRRMQRKPRWQVEVSTAWP